MTVVIVLCRHIKHTLLDYSHVLCTCFVHFVAQHRATATRVIGSSHIGRHWDAHLLILLGGTTSHISAAHTYVFKLVLWADTQLPQQLHWQLLSPGWTALQLQQDLVATIQYTLNTFNLLSTVSTCTQYIRQAVYALQRAPHKTYSTQALAGRY